MTTERLGVFGGTFDPVHIGHLIVAEILRDELQLDRVLFLPAGRPPHKPQQTMAANHHRLTMLNLAIRDAPGFSVNTIELDRTESSYTAVTLELLRDELPEDTKLFFLMGQDSLRDFPEWRDPTRIAQLAHLGVALRPGVDVAIGDVVRLVPETKDRIHVVTVPLIGISSRDIRERIQQRRAFTFQVPYGVAHYIQTHNLYINGRAETSLEPGI